MGKSTENDEKKYNQMYNNIVSVCWENDMLKMAASFIRQQMRQREGDREREKDGKRTLQSVHTEL